MPLRQGERLQAWCLPSGNGSFFRHGARLQAQRAPVPFRPGEHMCLSTRDAPSCTGHSRRHRECPLAGVHPQRVPMPFRQRECLQARGVPSDMLSGVRNWRVCAASTEPRLCAVSTGVLEAAVPRSWGTGGCSATATGFTGGSIAAGTGFTGGCRPRALGSLGLQCLTHCVHWMLQCHRHWVHWRVQCGGHWLHWWLKCRRHGVD